MMKKETIDRRHLFKAGSILLGSLGISTIVKASSCLTNAQQPEGPFYPEQDQLDKDNDLTQVIGKSQQALGDIVFLTGIVSDQNCVPLANTLVEIWQACESGKYNHSGDPNNAPLDPNFQYWGRALTNEKGEYLFKTIKPGSYRANATWMRPPHIHMKVHRRGFEELTTQIYFSDEKNLNRDDLILKRLSRQDQNNVVVKFETNQELNKVGLFNISLNTIR